MLFWVDSEVTRLVVTEQVKNQYSFLEAFVLSCSWFIDSVILFQFIALYHNLIKEVDLE